MNENEWIDSSILFLDVVEFSRHDEIEQKEIYEHLWKISKEKLQFYQEQQDYILKSTGDGMLLIALNPKINLIEIAKTLQKKLREKGIFLRQGLNCGKILPMNERRDAIGNPISICQRIMDCGESDHILASSHYLEVKIGKRPPRENFSDFGKVTVKHEENIHIFNYYDGKCGNPNFPHNLLLLFPKAKSFLTEGNWRDLLTCCNIIDLSHELCSKPSCSYTASSFNAINAEQTKGQAIGTIFITTRLQNVYMNYGTHIDFPGHILSDESELAKNVGSYLLDKFVCEGIVIDVHDKLKDIIPLVNHKGYFNFEELGHGEQIIENFLSIIGDMEITLDDFLEKVGGQNVAEKAILFCTGLDKYWRYEQFEPWSYVYFFNPYISVELAKFLIEKKVSLVGIDALQIENPVINLGGREPFPMISEKYKGIIKRKLQEVSQNFVHQMLLENDIMIVENLKGLTEIPQPKFLFIAVPLKLTVPGCVDNSITRPFALAFESRGR